MYCYNGAMQNVEQIIFLLSSWEYLPHTRKIRRENRCPRNIIFTKWLGANEYFKKWDAEWEMKKMSFVWILRLQNISTNFFVVAVACLSEWCYIWILSRQLLMPIISRVRTLAHAFLLWRNHLPPMVALFLLRKWQLKNVHSCSNPAL